MTSQIKQSVRPTSRIKDVTVSLSVGGSLTLEVRPYTNNILYVYILPGRVGSGTGYVLLQRSGFIPDSDETRRGSEVIIQVETARSANVGWGFSSILLSRYTWREMTTVLPTRPTSHSAKRLVPTFTPPVRPGPRCPTVLVFQIWVGFLCSFFRCSV